MNPEWVTDTILLSLFAYGCTFALLLLSYGLTRWRKMPFSFEHVVYLVGGFLILGGGSMSFGVESRPSYITNLSIFFLAQGVAVIVLGNIILWRKKATKLTPPISS